MMNPMKEPTIKKARKPRAPKTKSSALIDCPIESIVDDFSKFGISDEPIKTAIDKVAGEVRQTVLGHLGNYIEEPYTIIESYFEGQYLERLVRHQLESYNNFISHQIPKTIASTYAATTTQNMIRSAFCCKSN